MNVQGCNIIDILSWKTICIGVFPKRKSSEYNTNAWNAYIKYTIINIYIYKVNMQLIYD